MKLSLRRHSVWWPGYATWLSENIVGFRQGVLSRTSPSGYWQSPGPYGDQLSPCLVASTTNTAPPPSTWEVLRGVNLLYLSCFPSTLLFSFSVILITVINTSTHFPTLTSKLTSDCEKWRPLMKQSQTRPMWTIAAPYIRRVGTKTA